MNYDKKVFKRWSRFPISWKSSKHFRFTAAYFQENLLCDLLYRIVLTFQKFANIICVFHVRKNKRTAQKSFIHLFSNSIFNIWIHYFVSYFVIENKKWFFCKWKNQGRNKLCRKFIWNMFVIHLHALSLREDWKIFDIQYVLYHTGK